MMVFSISTTNLNWWTQDFWTINSMFSAPRIRNEKQSFLSLILNRGHDELPPKQCTCTSMCMGNTSTSPYTFTLFDPLQYGSFNMEHNGYWNLEAIIDHRNLEGYQRPYPLIRPYFLREGLNSSRYWTKTCWSPRTSCIVRLGIFHLRVWRRFRTGSVKT